VTKDDPGNSKLNERNWVCKKKKKERGKEKKEKKKRKREG
jgi:hypothetical protein